MTSRAWILAVTFGCSSMHHAAPPDAAIDSSSAAACNASNCDGQTHYCYQFTAGVAPMNGCNVLPASCNGTASCSCVTAAIGACGGALSCDEQNGLVFATCAGI